MRSFFALLFMLEACKPAPAPPSIAAPRDEARPVASVVPAVPTPTTSAPVGAMTLEKPASHPVTPKIEIRWQGGVDDEASDFRIVEGVQSVGLPALSRDGRLVIVLDENETAASCPSSQLIAFDRPHATATRGRIAWRIELPSVGCVPQWDVKPSGKRLTPEFIKLKSAISAANAKLAASTLRSFDGGDSWSPAQETVPAKRAYELAIKNDAEELPIRVSARGLSGDLFDLDLAPIAELGDPAFHDPPGTVRGGLIGGTTYDVDIAAHVLLVRGRYMSVNSWFRADQTTHVLFW